MNGTTETGSGLEIPNSPLSFFPLSVPIRQKQEKALDFSSRMIQRGIRDIVIAAPTGVGKSAIGAALAFWAAQDGLKLPGDPGGYYLCTQKLLQDQLEQDTGKYPKHLQSVISLKTSSEYPCPDFNDCGTGMRNKPPCSQLRAQCCTYMQQRAMFSLAKLSVTNYPYFFTERTYQKQLRPRKLLIADECHTLENQILRFIELVVGPKEIENFAPVVKRVPTLARLADFVAWVISEYRPVLISRLDAYDKEGDLPPERAKEMADLETQIGKVDKALEEIEANPKNWVYWQEHGNDNQLTALAKPLDAAPFFNSLFGDAGHVRIYMSAYPGSKEIFCRSLGLDADTVAMLSLGSMFPKENRPIHAAFVGSMSKKNVDTTMPSFLRATKKIMEVHGNEKGILHMNSYALCQAVWDFFNGQPEQKRLLFPRKADQRDLKFEEHKRSKLPTVILSPSFTEGFDFANDLARWQIIGKMPYPYLGDRQVAAKKDLDPEWYAMRTVMSVIQASGRICRNEKDTGITYILDSDFLYLWEKNSYMFPKWYQEAVIWNTRS